MKKVLILLFAFLAFAVSQEALANGGPKHPHKKCVKVKKKNKFKYAKCYRHRHGHKWVAGHYAHKHGIKVWMPGVWIKL